MIDILAVALPDFPVLGHLTPRSVALGAILLLFLGALIFAVLFFVVTRHVCYLPCCEGGLRPPRLEPRTNPAGEPPKQFDYSSDNTTG